MKYFILTLGLFLTTNIGFAQETKRLTAEKHNEYGLIYSLPQTHLDIEVVATKTTRKAGPYYQYAEKYLGIPGAITQDSEEWALSSVKVTPYGVPDPEEQYLMQFKPGGNGYIVLDENGLLLSINTEPVIDSIVSTAPKQKQKSPLDNNEYAKVYSEELLMSASTVKMAEVAAKQLYRIRESRLNLVTGEVDELPADGESFKLIIQQLDEQEAALTALFMGTTQTETIVKHFDYIPVEEVTNDIVFRISDLYGIVKSENLSGAPVYLSLKITKEGELPIDNKGNIKKMPKNAVAYAIPGKAEVILSDGKKTLFKENLPIAQFGVVFGLDPSIFTDKKPLLVRHSIRKQELSGKSANNMLLPYMKSGLAEAGCDEAGRGCLAGSVYAAAVILPPHFRNELLNDSKQLSEKQRYELRPIIEQEAVAWAIGIVTPEEIDRFNILNASFLAMHRAIEQLNPQPQHLLIDGNRFKPYPDIPHTCVVKGDGKYEAIAAASILAKTYRDDYMNRLHEQYPMYDWNRNKGYPTKAHRAAIRQYGPTPYHRMSFQLLERQLSIF